MNMTETQARLLAAGNRDYVARKIKGRWVVWSKRAEHVVEFDRIPIVEKA